MDGKEKTRGSKRAGESCTGGHILWSPEIQQSVDTRGWRDHGTAVRVINCGTLLPLASPVTATFTPVKAGGRSEVWKCKELKMARRDPQQPQVKGYLRAPSRAST